MDLDRSSYLKAIGVFASWAIVSFGQPAWSHPLSIAASLFGYALFWFATIDLNRPFLIGALWFAAVQLVQIGWLSSSEYMGPMIFVVYGLVSLLIGMQFGWMTALLKRPLSISHLLGLSGFWVLMEWARLLPLTGFPWNPVGVSLGANLYSVQFATLFGIYGLSFWVIFVNLLALRCLLGGFKEKFTWAIAASVPFLFGVANITFWESRAPKSGEKSIALVQTALMPEEKDFTRSKASAFVPPAVQWERILSYLKETKKEHFDWIILPEGALPLGAKRAFYPFHGVEQIWEREFGKEGTADFPPLEPPFFSNGRVSNAFWAQAIANHYQAEVIVGLLDVEGDETYNAAFHFKPRQPIANRYEKRVLVPIGEYMPLSEWEPLSKFVSKQFGIGDSFRAGSASKLFEGIVPIGISICSEETYGYIAREARRAGAELFVSISNDAWFPNTNLPWHHYTHGRIRAVENGVCLLRSCNTGITGALDCFGREVVSMPASDKLAGALAFSMPIQTFPTLYTLLGDVPPLLLSILLAGRLLIFQFRKKKLP